MISQPGEPSLATWSSRCPAKIKQTSWRPSWSSGSEPASRGNGHGYGHTVMPLNGSQPSVIKVIQVNLNYYWTAQFMDQTLLKRYTDIVLVSDYYWGFEDEFQWITSIDCRCAVYIPSHSSASIVVKGALFKSESITLCSIAAKLHPELLHPGVCYFFFSEIEALIRIQAPTDLNLIAAGNFNVEWWVCYWWRWGIASYRTRLQVYY